MSLAAPPRAGLADAEMAVRLQPEYPMGYLRKADFLPGGLEASVGAPGQIAPGVAFILF